MVPRGRWRGPIERDTKGDWKAWHVSVVTKGDESESLLLRAYRKEMLARVIGTVQSDSGEGRDTGRPGATCHRPLQGGRAEFRAVDPD